MQKELELNFLITAKINCTCLAILATLEGEQEPVKITCGHQKWFVQVI